MVATIILALDMASSEDELAAWWRDHMPVLRGLDREDLAAVVAAKDRRKALLAKRFAAHRTI